MSNDILSRLEAVIHQRRGADPSESYVAGLLAGGTDAIAKKIGEEATETVLAAKNGDKENLAHEIADLWFHTMVLMANQGVALEAVLAEFERRFGTSGIDEKASRNKS